MTNSASNNILEAISTLDSTMAKMVEQDPEKLEQLYGMIRLQIDNIEAKVSSLIVDQEDADDDHVYWSQINEAEVYYDSNKPLDGQELRKYLSMRLEAIYALLADKGIYQVTVDYGTDDLEVIQPRDMASEKA